MSAPLFTPGTNIFEGTLIDPFNSFTLPKKGIAPIVTAAQNDPNIQKQSLMTPGQKLEAADNGVPGSTSHFAANTYRNLESVKSSKNTIDASIKSIAQSIKSNYPQFKNYDDQTVVDTYFKLVPQAKEQYIGKAQKTLDTEANKSTFGRVLEGTKDVIAGDVNNMPGLLSIPGKIALGLTDSAQKLDTVGEDIYAKSQGKKTDRGWTENLFDTAEGLANIIPAIATPGAYGALSGIFSTPGVDKVMEKITGKSGDFVSMIPGMQQIINNLPEEKRAEAKSFLGMAAIATVLGLRVKDPVTGQYSLKTAGKSLLPQNLLPNILENTLGFSVKGAHPAGGSVLDSLVDLGVAGKKKIGELFPAKEPGAVNDVAAGAGAEAGGKMSLAPTQPKSDVSISDRLLSGFFGLDADTVKSIKENGTNFARVQKGELSPDTIEAKVNDLLDEMKGQKGIVGDVYNKLYNTDYTIDGNQVADQMMKFLEDKGISVDDNGKISYDSKKTVLNSKEVPVIQNVLKFVDDLRGGDRSIEDVHNVRKNIYQNRAYEDNMAKVPSKTVDNMVEFLDSKLKQAPGFADIDKLFGDKANKFNEIKDEFFTKKGDFKGEPTSLLLPKNKEKLALLEKYLPGTTKELEAIKADKDYQYTRNKHKVGLYDKAASIIGGFTVGGLPGAAAGFALNWIGRDPKLLVSFLTKEKGGSEVVKKIESGASLTEADKAVIAGALKKGEDYNQAQRAKTIAEGRVLPEPKATPITPEGVVQEKRVIKMKEPDQRRGLVEIEKPGAIKNPQAEAKAKEMAAEKKTIQMKKDAQAAENTDKTQKMEEYKKQVEDGTLIERRGYGHDNIPQVGDLTPLGKVIEVRGGGGMANKISVRVAGKDRFMSMEEVGGVYAPKVEANDFESIVKKTIETKDQTDPLSAITKNGKKDYYLKSLKDDFGIDVDNIKDAGDRKMVVDLLNSRSPEKQWEIAENLIKKYGTDEQKTMFQTNRLAGQDISNAEALDIVRKYFSPDEVNVQFVKSLTTPKGAEALGSYYDKMIKFVENPDAFVPEHEVLHAYFDMFTDPVRKADILETVKKQQGIMDNRGAEEWLADNFVQYARGTKSFMGKIKNFFSKVWNNIKGVFGKKDAVQGLYDDIIAKKRGESGSEDSKTMYKVKEDAKELAILHNLSDEKLQKIVDLGGMPMPSIAVTEAGIPFESFGDITLVGNKDLISKNKAKLYTADAYTPRVPQATIVLKNNAYKLIKDIAKDLDTPEWKVEQHMLGDGGLIPGIEKYADQIKEVTEKKLFKGFTYSGKRRYADYSLENILKEMKSKGKGNESAIFAGSLKQMVGKYSDSITPEQVRKIEFAPRTEELNNQYKANEEKYFEALRNISQKRNNKSTWDIAGDLSEAWSKSNSRVLENLKDWGYDNLTEADIQMVRDVIDETAAMPKDYIEAKIARGVDLDEFSYALVPEDQVDKVKGILKNTKLQDKVVGYKSTETRNQKLQDLQEKYGNIFFSLGGLILPAAMLLGNNMSSDNQT